MEKINGSEYTCQKCSKSFGENRGERRSPSFEKVGRSNNPFLCLECEEGIAYAQRVDVGKSSESSRGRYKEAEAMSDEYYVIPGVMTRFIEPGRDGRSWIYVKKDGYGPPRSINVEWNPALRVADNHYNAAQEWLDEFVPGSLIKNPGINFNGDFYWGWDRRQGEGEQVDA